MSGRVRTAGLLVLLSTGALAQDLGHKVPGTVGLNAGRQADPGLSVADQLLFYDAGIVRDREGDKLPVQGFRLGATGNSLGVSFTKPVEATNLNFALSVPLAIVTLNSEVPQASVDRFGFSDLRAQPIGVGWKLRHADVVSSYALYVPTGRFEVRRTGGLSRGSFGHELSVGGNGGFDRFFAGVLASYELNQKKIGVDIRRGDVLQFQGGVGAHVTKVWDMGLAAYALWQVTDDTGADLPPVLKGGRDRVLGAGPEASVLVPKLKAKFSLRYEHDFLVKSRTEGQMFCLTAAMKL